MSKLEDEVQLSARAEQSFSRADNCKTTWVVIAMLCFANWAQLLFAASTGPTFANAVTNGFINFSALSEASGVAASRQNAGVLWSHNDSGHAAQVFAIDTEGRLLGTYSIPGNTDNEDIGIGPGPLENISYLYVSDIGDNNINRAHIDIYQIPEPAVYGRQYTNPVTRSMKGARTITLQYPDGPHDAEAMFVDPATGDLFIATKENTSQIYFAPKSQLDTNDFFTLTFLRSLSFSVPSAADISPSGNEIIFRRESAASLWRRSPGESISNALGGTASTIPVTGVANGEPNGEAIGFDATGIGYFTLSDDITNQPLRYFARTSNDGPGPSPRELISGGSAWKYLDDGSSPLALWRQAAFDDSTWKNGLAQFGYGDNDEHTVISFGTNANAKYFTTYFRTSFVVNNAADITNVIARMVVDDGAVVFINGVAAIYENLSPGATSTTLAAPMPVALQSTWHSYRLAPNALFQGTNLVAVELHQSSITGSNVSFDLQLLAEGRNASYEPFNYTNGAPLIGLTNDMGQWWTAAGSGGTAATVEAGGLTVNGLFTQSGKSMRFGAVDGPSARFNLLQNITSGPTWFSLALKVTDLGNLSTAGSWLGGFNNSPGTQTNTPTVIGARILARANGAGAFNLGIAKNTTNAAEWFWHSNTFAVNETIFLVGSYTFNSSNAADDQVMLWLNPSPSTFGQDSSPAATLATTNGADITSDQIASFVFLQRGVGNQNQPGSVSVAELRIGPSWASVTPPARLIPQLNIASSGTNLVLSWSTNAPTFALESSLNLAGNWTQVLAPVNVTNSSLAVTLPLGSGLAFFRLRQLP